MSYITKNGAYLFVLCALSCAVSAAACQRGQLSCFCRRLGGQWRQGRPPMIPTCRLNYRHQGRDRWVHLYLPQSYDGRKGFPMWVHLHGVFWNTMGNIGQRLGPIDGTDIIPTWDLAIKQFGSQAIFVYPQSTGYAGSGNAAADVDPVRGPKYRQFWNVPFWKCSVGVCVDRSVDDIGFIETVVLNLVRRLPVNRRQVMLSGVSAGGMMVQALLCQSAKITRVITAAVDMLGGLGRDFGLGPQCSRRAAAAAAVPFLKLHGVKDGSLTWNRRTLVDGVPFLSAVESAEVHARRRGCSPQRGESTRWFNSGGGTITCRNMCRSTPRAKTVRICGMFNTGHDTDHPWPGFVYQQAWNFMREHR